MPHQPAEEWDCFSDSRILGMVFSTVLVEYNPRLFEADTSLSTIDVP
jgi:hypothetical protein